METLPPILLQWLLAIPILGGCVYYFAQARELAVRGSRLDAGFFGLPDLFMGTALAVYFGVNGLFILLKSDATPELRVEHVRSNLAFMVVVLITVLVFVSARRISLTRAFNLGLDGIGLIPLRAAVALVTALPPIWGIGFIWERYLQNSSPEQALVGLFRASAESGDWSSVRLVVLSAFLQAPVVEEVLFRGYFYITLKRYVGSIGSALVVSALFALCHGNVRVIPGLFILSISEIITFERFGSLWVCIFMHACFNGLSLLLLYMESQGWLPH